MVYLSTSKNVLKIACMMRVVQLMATGLLHNLVNFEPVPSFLHSSSGAAIVAKRSPQLTNGHGLGGQDEHPWVEGMPLGDIFIKTMKRAWEIQESRKRESMSPKQVPLAYSKTS